jgi:hypothetical protein
LLKDTPRDFSKLKHATRGFYAIGVYLKTSLLKHTCKRLPLLKHNCLRLYPVPDSQSSQTKSSFPKAKSVRIGNSSRSPVSILTIHLNLNLLSYITQIAKIMRLYIENTVNLKGDDNCGYQIIARHVSMDRENHILVRNAIIHELKTNKCDYLLIFGSDECFEYITNDLHPFTIMVKLYTYISD